MSEDAVIPEIQPSQESEIRGIQIEHAAESDVGKVRGLDEDSFFSGSKGSEHIIGLAEAHDGDAVEQTESAKESADKIFENGVDGLFIVADGMGGHAGGEEASRLAVDKVLKGLSTTEDWASLSPEQIQEGIKKAVEQANKAVYDKNQESSKDSRTTFTMAMVVNGELYTANVGDSRVYTYDEATGNFTRLTTDHSMAADLVAKETINDEQLYTSPFRNQLTRSLGKGESVEVDISGPIKVEGDVKILTCCDGLWGIKDPALKEILAKDKPEGEIVKELIKTANDAGGDDNITAVVASLHVQEATTGSDAPEPEPDSGEARRMSPGESGEIRRLMGEQEYGRRKKEAMRRIEDNEDREGHLLFTNLQKSFGENPSILKYGPAARTYREAKASAEKLDDPAEVQKAIISLQTFCGHLGLGRYEVKIETEGGETEEERREMIKDQVRRDVEKLPEEYARSRMADYIDHRVKTDHLKEKLAESFPVGKIYETGVDLTKTPPRQLVRLNAVRMQSEADRGYWAALRILDDIGDEDVSIEFHNLRNDRLSPGEEAVVAQTPFSEKSDDERARLINERTASLRREIDQTKGEKVVEAFDHLPDFDREDLVSCLIMDENEAALADEGYKKAIELEDADVIVDAVSRSKEVRLRLKESLAELDIALAAQRSRDASSRFTQARREVALGGRQTRMPDKGVVGEWLSAAKERVSSLVGEHVAELKRDVAPHVDEVMRKAESADDAYVKGVVWLGEQFDATVGRAAHAVKEEVKLVGRELHDLDDRVYHSNRERRKIRIRRLYLDKKHAASVTKERALASVGVKREGLGRRFALRFRETLGGSALSTEEKNELEARRDRVTRGARMLRRIKGGEFDEERKHPDFEYFWEQVESSTRDLGEERRAEEAAKAAETARVAKEKAAAERSAKAAKKAETDVENKNVETKVLPAEYDEVISYTTNEGERHLVALWWDEKEQKVTRAEVSEDGSILENTLHDESEDVSSKEDADRIVEEAAGNIQRQREQEGLAFQRGLRFELDNEGGDMYKLVGFAPREKETAPKIEEAPPLREEMEDHFVDRITNDSGDVEIRMTWLRDRDVIQEDVDDRGNPLNEDNKRRINCENAESARSEFERSKESSAKLASERDDMESGLQFTWDSEEEWTLPKKVEEEEGLEIKEESVNLDGFREGMVGKPLVYQSGGNLYVWWVGKRGSMWSINKEKVNTSGEKDEKTPSGAREDYYELEKALEYLKRDGDRFKADEKIDTDWRIVPGDEEGQFKLVKDERQDLKTGGGKEEQENGPGDKVDIEDINEAKLWDDVMKQREQKEEAREGFEGHRNPLTHSEYLRTIGMWEDSLVASNQYLNRKLSPDRNDIDFEDYDTYIELQRDLLDTHRNLRKIQRETDRNAEREAELLTIYEGLLQRKRLTYSKLVKQGVV